MSIEWIEIACRVFLVVVVIIQGILLLGARKVANERAKKAYDAGIAVGFEEGKAKEGPGITPGMKNVIREIKRGHRRG